MTIPARRLILFLVAAAAVAACAAGPRPASGDAGAVTSGVPLSEDRPRPGVTPGVTLHATAIQVCTPGWAGRHRRGLTAAQKAMVLEAYGLRPDQPVAEWDHRIALELGGANGTRNVWPQLSSDDSRRKDRLEGRLHVAVCAGRLDLAAAQDRVSTWWDDPLW